MNYNNKKHLEGFDEIWSSVSAEIQIARKREVFGQKLGVFVKVAASIMIVCGLVLTGYLNISKFSKKEVCACDSWQIDGVSRSISVSSEYPLVCEKKVYVLRGESNNQRILCVDKHTGAMIWESDLRVNDCRLIANNTHLFVLTSQARGLWAWIALDSASGTELWRDTVQNDIVSRPSYLALFENGVCWSQGSRVFLAHPETGKMIWSSNISDTTQLSAPVEYNGKVLVASEDCLYAVNADDGSMMWLRQYAAKERLFTRPLLSVDAGRVFVARSGGGAKSDLWCMMPERGDVLWQQEIAAPVTLQSSGGKVFVRTNGLKAFDGLTGALLWSSDVRGCSPVSFKDDFVLVAESQGNQDVVVLNVMTGVEVETHHLASSCNGFMVSGGMGLLTGHNNVLYAICIDSRKDSFL